MSRDDDILRLYAEGKKIKEIAEAVGCAANTVGVRLKSLGVDRPSKPQKRWGGKDDPTLKVIELWDQGLCVSQISERLMESQQTVGDILSAAKKRSATSKRYRYDGSAPGGSGRDGFAGSMARRT